MGTQSTGLDACATGAAHRGRGAAVKHLGVCLAALRVNSLKRIREAFHQVAIGPMDAVRDAGDCAVVAPAFLGDFGPFAGAT